MSKVVKFGGTSLADASQIKKVCEIIKSDKERRYVVPSAPGKRFKDDIKKYLKNKRLKLKDVFQMTANEKKELIHIKKEAGI